MLTYFSANVFNMSTKCVNINIVFFIEDCYGVLLTNYKLMYIYYISIENEADLNKVVVLSSYEGGR